MKSPFSSIHQKNYFFNTGWLLADRVVRIFANFLVGILVVRYLGPENYGFFNYAIAAVYFFQPIANLGMGDIVIRELVRNDGKEKEILGTAILTRLGGGLLVLSLVILINYISEYGTINYSLILITCSLLLIQSTDVIDKYFQAKLRSKLNVKASFIAMIISSIIKVILVYIKAPLIYFIFAYILDYLIISIVLLYYFRKLEGGFSFKFNKNLAIGFLKQSWPLIISGIMVVVYMRIDQVMIQKMLDANALGNFSAAVKLGESYYFVPAIIATSLFSAIINGKALGEDVYRKRMQKLYDLLTWIAVPAAIVISLFADPLTHFLYGAKYSGGVGSVLAIHVWAGVFVFWGSASGKWYIVEKIPRYITINTTLGCIVNVSLNIFLIPRMGIIGAAMATFAAQFTAVCLGPLIFKESRMVVWHMFNSLNVFRVGKSALHAAKKIMATR